MTLLRRIRIATALVVALAAAPALATGAAAPRMSANSIDSIAVPDAPFDRSADADHDVAAAFARAAEEHKRVLIDLGANWCADCRILVGVMALPELRAFLDAHFAVVSVDVGRFNRNLQIPARFGVTDRLEGVPIILIATPDGMLVNRGHVDALVEARKLTPQAISDWLATWAE